MENRSKIVCDRMVFELMREELERRELKFEVSSSSKQMIGPDEIEIILQAAGVVANSIIAWAAVHPIIAGRAKLKEENEKKD